MPAQILVSRMTRAEVEKKIAELQAGDVLAIGVNAGKGCLVQSKIPVVRRGPELDRAYQLLQAIADADSVIGAQRRKARGDDVEVDEQPAKPATVQPKKLGKPGPQG